MNAPTNATGTAADAVQAMSAAAQQLTTEVERVKVITTTEQYQTAGEIVKGIDLLRKDIEAHYDPICAAAHKTHKMLTAARAGLLDPLTEKRKLVSRARLAWEEEQERIAAEERRKLETEAQRQHEEAALAAAEEAEQHGDTALAEQLIAEAAEVPTQLAVKVEPDLPKTQGLGSRRLLWDFEITDPLRVEPFNGFLALYYEQEDAGKCPTFLAQLREHVVKDEKGWRVGFARLDEVAIGKAVRAMGEGAKALLGPGVRIYQRKGEEARGR